MQELLNCCKNMTPIYDVKMVNYGNLCLHNVNNVSWVMPDEHLNKTAVKNKNIYNATCTLRINNYLSMYHLTISVGTSCEALAQNDPAHDFYPNSTLFL